MYYDGELFSSKNSGRRVKSANKAGHAPRGSQEKVYHRVFYVFLPASIHLYHFFEVGGT